MATAKLRILRDGQELGELELSVAEALALLGDGFLRATDRFWIPGTAHEGVLSDLSANLKSGPDSWLNRVQSSATSANELVQRTARQTVGQVSGVARQKTSEVANATNRWLEDYLPRLRREVSSRLATSTVCAETQLRDEQFLRKVFGAVYDCLPKPVGRFVGEAGFVEFCLKHRAFLLKRRNTNPEDSERSDD